MVALSYLTGCLYSTTGISLMLGCDQDLLSYLSLVVISSPASSVILLFLGMTPAVEHVPEEQKGMRIHEKGLRNTKKLNI